MATNYGSFSWPASATANASVALTGITAPTSATEVGGINPGGNLQALQLDASGNLKTNTAVTVSLPPNLNGAEQQIVNLTTIQQSFTPPANAVGFILESDSGNTVNLRWAIVTAVTTTAGVLMEPGRDTGYIPCGAAVNVIAVSGSNQSVYIQWIMSS